MQMNGLNELITVAKYWRRWSDPRLIVLVLNNRDLNEVTWEDPDARDVLALGSISCLTFKLEVVVPVARVHAGRPSSSPRPTSEPLPPSFRPKPSSSPSSVSPSSAARSESSSRPSSSGPGRLTGSVGSISRRR